MFGLNLTELVVVLVIALVVFGPRRLPDIGESIGRAIRNFRKGLKDDSVTVDDSLRSACPDAPTLDSGINGDDSLRSARPDAPTLDSGINGDDSLRDDNPVTVDKAGELPPPPPEEPRNGGRAN